MKVWAMVLLSLITVTAMTAYGWAIWVLLTTMDREEGA